MTDKKKPKQRRTFNAQRVREEKFAKNLIAGKTAKEAAYAAYAVTNDKSAESKALTVLKRPHVQKRIGELMDEYQPGWDMQLSQLGSAAIAEAIKSGNAEVMSRVFERISKVSGKAAPQQTETKSLKASVKLPGSD